MRYARYPSRMYTPPVLAYKGYNEVLRGIGGPEAASIGYFVVFNIRYGLRSWSSTPAFTKTGGLVSASYDDTMGFTPWHPCKCSSALGLCVP